MILRPLLFTLIFLSNAIAQAKKTEMLTAEILSLHPTQFAVGFNEVIAKREEMEGMSLKKLEKFLRKKPIPVVVGPNQQLYMTDHHHHAQAILSMGMKNTFIKILHDWSGYSDARFWDKMKASGYGYLFDENGYGPLSPTQLPENIRGLKDDPYRGLAWFVEKQGAIEEVDVPYDSFAWANFFRSRISRRIIDNDFEKAIDIAVDLAYSDEAADLPGYIGSSCEKQFSRVD